MKHHSRKRGITAKRLQIARYCKSPGLDGRGLYKEGCQAELRVRAFGIPTPALGCWAALYCR